MIERKKETNNKEKVKLKSQTLINKKDLLKETILMKPQIEQLTKIGLKNFTDRTELKNEYVKEESKTWFMHRKHLTFFFIHQIQPEKLKKIDKLVYIPISNKNSLLAKNIIYYYIFLQYQNPLIKNFYRNDRIIKLTNDDPFK